MSIISLPEALSFLDIGKGYFEITAENDVLCMTSDQTADPDSPSNIDVPDGTYEGDDLATALETAMNADDDLTGTNAITFSVSYSSYLFTIAIDEEDEHTITIDVSASDAALTFGFTEDPTAASSITSDQAAAEDPTDIVDTINDGVDKWVKEYCQRDFEETTYTKKLYDGEGSPYLFLKQYPIISVERLAIGTINGIKVHNASADATRATVTVNNTGLVLTITGGANAGSDTLLFADYATLTLLAAAITDIVDVTTGLSKDWTASVVNSSYAGHASSELLPRYGAYCGGATWAYLEMPDEPLTDFKVYPDKGIVYYSGGFSDVIIDYTAGYATLPEDLKLAVSMLVKMIYDRRGQEVFGVEQFSLGYVRSVLTKEMPDEVREILSRYRKIEV